MSAAPVRIVVVGNPTASTESTLEGLARSGWESHAVKTVREAETVLRTVRFQLILASEKLPDGTGYELAPLIAQQLGSLFISVGLSGTCLWLPAVENGVRSLGERALNPEMLAAEVEFILRAGDTGDVRPERDGGDCTISAGRGGRAKTPPTGAVLRLTEVERFGREAEHEYGYGEDEAPGRFIVPHGQLVARASRPAERDISLVPADGARPTSRALAKRWRGV